jgi:hypothetical protein
LLSRLRRLRIGFRFLFLCPLLLSRFVSACKDSRGRTDSRTLIRVVVGDFADHSAGALDAG